MGIPTPHMVAVGLLTLCSGYPTVDTLSKTQFTLTFNAPSYPALPLIAIPHSVPSSNFALIFDPFFARPGTPASIDNTYLDFNINDDSYSMHYGDPGEVHGIALLVTAEKGHIGGTPGIRSGSGDLGAPMTSADQSFFACNRMTGGMQHLALHFGVFNANGTAPYECVVASLEQKFNVAT
jgi:hypothetical protein